MGTGGQAPSVASDTGDKSLMCTSLLKQACLTFTFAGKPQMNPPPHIYDEQNFHRQHLLDLRQLNPCCDSNNITVLLASSFQGYYCGKEGKLCAMLRAHTTTIVHQEVIESHSDPIKTISI